MIKASLTSIHNLFFNEHNRIASKLFESLKGTVADEKELDELVYQVDNTEGSKESIFNVPGVKAYCFWCNAEHNIQ